MATVTVPRLCGGFKRQRGKKFLCTRMGFEIE
jgi:hypothetical protein